MSTKVYFFGVSGPKIEHGAGHYLYERFECRIPGLVPEVRSCVRIANHYDPMFRPLLPMDARWCKRDAYMPTLFTPPECERQGQARLHHVEGWTIIAWWDRSGSNRPGSNVAFFVQGEHTFERALLYARERFPDEIRRMESSYIIEFAP